MPQSAHRSFPPRVASGLHLGGYAPGLRSAADIASFINTKTEYVAGYRRPVTESAAYCAMSRLRDLGVDQGPDNKSTARKYGRPTKESSMSRYPHNLELTETSQFALVGSITTRKDGDKIFSVVRSENGLVEHTGDEDRRQAVIGDLKSDGFEVCEVDGEILNLVTDVVLGEYGDIPIEEEA